jgi:hypothetical protein
MLLMFLAFYFGDAQRCLQYLVLQSSDWSGTDDYTIFNKLSQNLASVECCTSPQNHINYTAKSREESQLNFLFYGQASGRTTRFTPSSVEERQEGNANVALGS